MGCCFLDLLEFWLIYKASILNFLIKAIVDAIKILHAWDEKKGKWNRKNLNPYIYIYIKLGLSLASGLMYGIGWLGCFAIRSRTGIKANLLWTACLMQILMDSPFPSGDTKRRSASTATSRTAGACFHSLLSNSTSQAGLSGSAAALRFGCRGMAGPSHVRELQGIKPNS